MCRYARLCILSLASSPVGQPRSADCPAVGPDGLEFLGGRRTPIVCVPAVRGERRCRPERLRALLTAAFRGGMVRLRKRLTCSPRPGLKSGGKALEQWLRGRVLRATLPASFISALPSGRSGTAAKMDFSALCQFSHRLDRAKLGEADLHLHSGTEYPAAAREAAGYRHARRRSSASLRRRSLQRNLEADPLYVRARRMTSSFAGKPLEGQPERLGEPRT
jgi:hypothetical protein